MEKAAQLLVTGGIVRCIHSPVVLTEELLALSLGEISQDNQRIGGVIRGLCGHVDQLTPACRTHPFRRTGRGAGWVRGHLAELAAGGVEFAGIPHSGHWPMYANPVAIWAHIATFLRQAAAR